MPPDSLLDLICKGLAEDYTAKEARTALCLPGGFLAEEHSIPATLLCQYKNYWQQHNSRLYYRTQQYVLAAGIGHMEVYWRHYNNPIAGHFGAKDTLVLVSRKYYRPGMSCKVKCYTRAC